MPDHSFTLQAVMELQKSCGQLAAKIDSLSTQIDKMETGIKTDADRFDGRLDNVDRAVRDVDTRIKIGTKVAYIICVILVGVISIGWTLTQDAFKDVTKTVITSAFQAKEAGAAQAAAPALQAPARPPEAIQK